MIITKPMKPYKLTEGELLYVKFPVLATPKIDGIRCTKINGQALSASHKPIPNTYIRELIENSSVPNGFDGEIITPGKFHDVTSAVMRESGRPTFLWRVFDAVSDGVYKDRVQDVDIWFKSHKCEFCDPVLPDQIRDFNELEEYENIALEQGYEGVCLRAFNSLYKNGRSTLREQGLLAIKRFTDAEAKVVGFEERMHNSNEAYQDEIGRTKRSSALKGQIGLGTLGALVVEDKGVTFKLGTGFDSALAQQVWDNQALYLGKLVKYKSFKHGAFEKPRHPVFLGFRDERDLCK